jgi:hypothetical protein
VQTVEAEIWVGCTSVQEYMSSVLDMNPAEYALMSSGEEISAAEAEDIVSKAVYPLVSQTSSPKGHLEGQPPLSTANCVVDAVKAPQNKEANVAAHNQNAASPSSVQDMPTSFHMTLFVFVHSRWSVGPAERVCPTGPAPDVSAGEKAAPSQMVDLSIREPRVGICTLISAGDRESAEGRIVEAVCAHPSSAVVAGAVSCMVGALLGVGRTEKPKQVETRIFDPVVRSWCIFRLVKTDNLNSESIVSR